MSNVRIQGRFVSNRVSADECLAEASRILNRVDLLSRGVLRCDTTGNANRLNDYIREAMGKLRNAEKLLEQRGSE